MKKHVLPAYLPPSLAAPLPRHWKDAFFPRAAAGSTVIYYSLACHNMSKIVFPILKKEMSGE